MPVGFEVSGQFGVVDLPRTILATGCGGWWKAAMAITGLRRPVAALLMVNVDVSRDQHTYGAAGTHHPARTMATRHSSSARPAL